MNDDRPCILLVDDKEANLVALEAALSRMDCGLVRATSGNEALRLMLRQEFAAILLDVQMPEMDGYEVARLAQLRASTSRVPILFVTAMHESEEAVIRGYESGVVDVLFKPVNPHILRGKVSIFLDLYRSKRALSREKDLENQQILAASRMKSDFLANMSHELRTPLNAILGFAELLHDGHVTSDMPQHKEFLADILSSGRHLLQLINDVLDLSKVEAGKLVFSPTPVNIEAVGREGVSMLRGLAAEKRLEVEVEVSEGLDDIAIDKARLLQVLYNYLSNAIKFTREGGVVRVRIKPEDRERFRLEVEDTGIGISEDDLRRLFVAFQQLDSGLAKKVGGTGLGLALTKRLVEAQGGEVGVRSELTKGSTFHAVLPRQPRSSGGEQQS